VIVTIATLLSACPSFALNVNESGPMLDDRLAPAVARSPALARKALGHAPCGLVCRVGRGSRFAFAPEGDVRRDLARLQHGKRGVIAIARIGQHL
jgi:hypothetical protein